MSKLSDSCTPFEKRHKYGQWYTEWLSKYEPTYADTVISCEVAFILAVRDGDNPETANERVKEMREWVADGDDPEEVLRGEAGLEPDFIFDLLEE